MAKRVNQVKTKLLCLTLLAGVILYSCQSDVNDAFVEDNKDSEQLLEAAKRIYNSVSSGETMRFRASTSDSEGLQVKPIWEFLQAEQRDEYSVLEIGLSSEYRFNFATPESFARAEEGNDPRYRLSKTSFIYITDREEEGREDMFMMTIVPDLSYLELTDFRPFEQVSYLYRDENFSGLIFYHNLDGDYVSGFRYENGEVTGTMQPNDGTLDFGTPQTRLSCTQYEITEIWEKCTFWGPGNASGEMLYVSGYECSTYYGSTHSYQVCVDTPDMNGDYSWGGTGPNNNDDHSDPTVTLSVVPGTGIVDLGDVVTFSVTLFPSAATSNVRYEIGKDGVYHTMTTTNIHSYRGTLLAPGRWSARVVVSLMKNGNTVTSQSVPIEVRYPDVSRVQRDGTITAAMNATWQQTKSAASASGRQEFGFWIYANTTSGSLSFEVGAPQNGIPVLCNTNASIDPGGAREQIPSTAPNSPMVGGKYHVAHFHTHTPQTYCPRYDTNGRLLARDVGPTLPDISWASSTNIPGLVYDYIAINYSEYGAFGIAGGHNINAPAQVYPFGPSRRPTPSF